MVYNKADQLTSWPGMHTYTYYGDGSLHEVKDASGVNTLRSYTYTPDALLKTATYNGKMLTNVWDTDKNRVSFIAGENTHTFVYDTTAGIPAVIRENGVYYVREPEGALIARLDGTSISYYHFDAIGSTRLLTDSDGDVTNKYTYDAYGSVISHNEFTGSVDQPYQYVGQFGYYTHYQEPDFGLMQLGVRFYDAEVGRFTSRDEFALFRSSPYSYVSGKPTRATDPSGLVTVIDPGGYQTCAASACYDGSNARVEVTEYHRTVKRLDKWAFSKCLASEFGTDIAEFALCFAIKGCWKLIPSPPLLAACLAECLAPGPGDEEALEKILQCYRNSKKWVTETMTVSCCTSGSITYCDKNRPDPKSGWKPVHY
jgi:RHS repeat-associated protein